MLPFSFSINNFFCFCRLHGNYNITTLYFLNISVFMFSHTNKNFSFLSFVLLRYDWLILSTHRSLGPGPSPFVPLDEISTELTKTSFFLVWIDQSILSLEPQALHRGTLIKVCAPALGTFSAFILPWPSHVAAWGMCVSVSPWNIFFLF